MNIQLLSQYGEAVPLLVLVLTLLGILIKNHFTLIDAVQRVGDLERRVETLEDKSETQYLQIMVELSHIKTMLGMIVGDKK